MIQNKEQNVITLLVLHGRNLRVHYWDATGLVVFLKGIGCCYQFLMINKYISSTFAAVPRVSGLTSRPSRSAPWS